MGEIHVMKIYNLTRLIESVKAMCMWNKSTEVLCGKESIIWDTKVKYDHTVRYIYKIYVKQ